MKKIGDLRKEQLYKDIEEEQQNRGIPKELVELNIKFDKTSNKIVSSVVKSIANKIIEPMLNSVNDTNEKIEKIIQFVSNDNNISFTISKLDPDDEEKNLLNVIVGERNFGNGNRRNSKEFYNEQGIKLYINDLDHNNTDCITMLNMKLKDSLSKVWYLKNNRTKKSYTSDLSNVLAAIYLLNKLYEFSSINRELVEFAVVDKVMAYGYVPNVESLTIIKNIQQKYNLIDNDDIEVDERMTDKYLKWLDFDTFNIYNNFYKIGAKTSFCSFTPIACDKISLILKYLMDENEEIVNEVELKHKNSSEYALSYETKKNIPEYILEKMKKNKFLEYFGYIEIDEECDLQKISQLEDEFEVYMKQLNLAINAKDHSLRFRKLGKQKASGLYYSGKKAVCIDLKDPSSYTHESFHMIDYTSGIGKKLSDSYSFRQIVNTYKTLVTKDIDSLDDENKIKKSFYGKTKYNRNYYFTLTEIFARCGEIYVSKILNINNSLTSDCEEMFYPKNQRFLTSVKTYFDNLFKSLEV